MSEQSAFVLEGPRLRPLTFLVWLVLKYWLVWCVSDDTDRRNRNSQRKNCPRTTLSTKYLTLTDPECMYSLKYTHTHTYIYIYIYIYIYYMIRTPKCVLYKRLEIFSRINLTTSEFVFMSSLRQVNLLMVRLYWTYPKFKAGVLVRHQQTLGTIKKKIFLWILYFIFS